MGFLVNSETVVNSDSKSEYSSNDLRSVGLDTGVQVAVGTSKTEDTFVDELVSFARVAIPSKIGH